MHMTILRCLRALCGAAGLAGAMAVLQVPAEAQHANAVRLVAGMKAETATHKTIQQIKSVPPRKRSRCYG
jgi:hypothetical protein